MSPNHFMGVWFFYFFQSFELLAMREKVLSLEYLSQHTLNNTWLQWWCFIWQIVLSCSNFIWQQNKRKHFKDKITLDLYACMHVWICFFHALQRRSLFNNFYMSCPVAMSNQELINAGTTTMNETDQAIDRTKKVNCFWNMD